MKVIKSSSVETNLNKLGIFIEYLNKTTKRVIPYLIFEKRLIAQPAPPTNQL